jgi:hypothetical protein
MPAWAAAAAAAAVTAAAAAAAVTAAAAMAAPAALRHPPGTYPSRWPLFRKRTPQALQRWGAVGGPRRQAGECRLDEGLRGWRGSGVREGAPQSDTHARTHT